MNLLMSENPYGYRLNVNHPRVRPLYERYRAWRGVPRGFPLSDEQRLEFEDLVLASWDRRERK